ncbi:MAG: ATP-binding cassette domain-containing protein, partial [Actinobacteria bacterium]|nr:ATP-binding cassette domain-containing protein [Actinomycetota bacterium]
GRGAASEPIDLEVRAGEILGIAGVEGNGQSDLVEAIVGLRPALAGSIELQGRPIHGLPVAARAALGLAHVPEDPRRTGLLLGFPVSWNIGLRHFRRAGRAPRRWFVDFRALRRLAAEAIATFDVRGATSDRPAGQLSGGNQQKLVLARELSTRPAALVAVNPTVGLDVGAQSFVYETLRAERDRGTAVILVSTDLDEIEALADRIAVLYRGRITGIVPPGSGYRDRVGQLMGGMDVAAAS